MRLRSAALLALAFLAGCGSGASDARVANAPATATPKGTATDAHGWRTEVTPTPTGWTIRVTVTGPLTVADGCVSAITPAITGPHGAAHLQPQMICMHMTPPTHVAAGESATFTKSVYTPLTDDAAGNVPAPRGWYSVGGTLAVVAGDGTVDTPFAPVSMWYAGV